MHDFVSDWAALPHFGLGSRPNLRKRNIFRGLDAAGHFLSFLARLSDRSSIHSLISTKEF